MENNINTLRKLNIIKRAIEELDLDFDECDSLDKILCDADNAIMESVYCDGEINVDYIDECERNSHYTHIYWQDKNGFVFEADGEFISTNDRHNTYYRKDEKGNFTEIPWFEHIEDDYILMDWVIDSDGLVVALVCK